MRGSQKQDGQPDNFTAGSSAEVEAVYREAVRLATIGGYRTVQIEHVLIALVRALRTLDLGARLSIAHRISIAGASLAELADLAWVALTSFPHLSFTTEGFTDEALSVVGRSIRAAQTLRHEEVGPEHLLLGLLATNNVASRVMKDAGVTAERAASELSRLRPGTRQWPPTGSAIALNADVGRILDVAREKAILEASSKITTSSILRALLEAEPPLLRAMFDRMSVDAAELGETLTTRLREATD